jgi:O-antigen/teichoic acid export membrane protein
VSRNDLVRGALTLVAGTGAAQLIVIAASPILTRIYPVEDYGSFAVVTSVLAIILSVVSLRYEYAIPLPEDDVAAANVLALCVAVTISMSVGSALVLWLMGPVILQWFGAGQIGGSIVFVAVGALGGGIVTAFISWAVRSKNYSEIAANRLTQGVTQAGTQIGLGLLGWGTLGLFFGMIAAAVAGSTRLVRSAWRTDPHSLRSVSITGIRAAAKRYRRFPLFSAPSALINTVGLETPLLLIVLLYGTYVGGQFALAQRVIGLPIALVAAAIGQAYFAEAARRMRERPAELKSLFVRTTRTLALGAIGPFGLAMVLSPLLFGVIFGSNWVDAGVYIAAMAPWYYLQFVTSSTGQTLDVLERQDLHLVREVLRVGLLASSILAAAVLNLGSLGAIVALSVGGCATYVLYGLISWLAIVRHHAGQMAAGVSPTDLMLDVPELPRA